MVTPKGTQALVRDAIANAPVSLRKLAAETGLAHTTLQGIKEGRENATVRVIGEIAAALERIGQEKANEAAWCQKTVAALRETLERGEV